MITRAIAIENLKKFIGKELSEYANEYGITIYSELNKFNKGWKGHVLERLSGLENNNSKAPNGIGFELKSVSYKKNRDGSLVPKETMAITMINPTELINTEFYQSHCWEKLKSIVFCYVLCGEDKFSKTANLLDIKSFDMLSDEELLKEIKNDYDFIRKECTLNGFNSLTGKYGKWIQPRTKGAGHGTTSRAFYARKELLKKIFSI